jgi:DtxR family Mn-dependent transcriptional regulator
MLSRKAEDYLEAILNITEEKGYTRVKDIALALDIQPSSVVEMLKKLNGNGYVVYRKYDGVTLTQKGKEMGSMVKDRHDTLKALLEILQVPEIEEFCAVCKVRTRLSTMASALQNVL